MELQPHLREVQAVPKALIAFVLGWLGGYLHGVAVGERDRVDRDP